MNRQPQAGHAFILGNDTYSKMIRALKIKPGTPSKQQDTETNVISIVNDSGGNLELGQILEVTDSFNNNHADESFAETNLFSGDTPDSSSTKLAIFQEPVADTEVGNAAIAGAANALINITSTSHKFAVPNGSSTLQSSDSGSIEILDAVTATGEKLYKVLFQGGASALGYEYAVIDFSYDFEPGELSPTYAPTWSNAFTTNNGVIEVDAGGLKIKESGDFLYFVEGQVNYEFTEELEFRRIQNGSYTFSSLSPGSSSANTINLTYSFTPNAPAISATITSWTGNGIPIPYATTVTSNSFNLSLINKHTTESTGSVTIDWQAIEKVSRFKHLWASPVRVDVALKSSVAGVLHETTRVRLDDRLIDVIGEASPEDWNSKFAFNGWSSAVKNSSDLLTFFITKTSESSSISDTSFVKSVEGTLTVVNKDGLANDYSP